MPHQAQSAKQKAAPQVAAQDEKEDALLRPSLGPHTHVLNLAQLAALAKETEANARNAKKPNAASPSSSLGRTVLPNPPAAGYVSANPTSGDASAKRKPPSPLRSTHPPPSPPQSKRNVPASNPSPAAPPNSQGKTNLSHPNGMGSPNKAAPKRPLSPLAKSVQYRAATALENTMPRSMSAPPRQPLSPTVRSTSPTPLRKVDLTALVTAIRPLPSFQAQVRRLCHLNNMDIAWLATLSTGGSVPSSFSTVDMMADDVLLKGPIKGRGPALLNSPRSALACLRTGIYPMDVQQRPLASFATEAPGAAPSEDILRRRQEFYETQRKVKLQVLKEEYAAICRVVTTNDLLNFFRNYDATHPVTAYQVALPFEEPSSGIDYSMSVEQEVLAQKERSQKMIEARRRELEKRLKHTQDIQKSYEAAMEARRAFEQKTQEAREEERRQRELKAEQQKQRQSEWKQHLEDLEKEHAEQVAKRQALLLEKEQLRTQILVETQEKRRQELEVKAARNAERLAANKEKMASLMEQRRAKLEDKEAAVEAKRLQMETLKVKEREAMQLKAQQMAAHQQQITIEAQRRLEERQMEQQLHQQQAEDRLREFWALQTQKREERRQEEQKREEARQQVLQAAKDEEERRRQEAIQKQTKQGEAYREKLRQQELAATLASEDTALARAAKAEFVERQQRIQAFDKLKSIDQLQRKADRVQNAEMRKQRILQERREERLQMELEKEKMLERIRSQFDGLEVTI